jgi:hypothetical protein
MLEKGLWHPKQSLKGLRGPGLIEAVIPQSPMTIIQNISLVGHGITA